MDDEPAETVNIKELDFHLINPNTRTQHEEKQGGVTILFIGKRGTGKSTAIKAFLYAKKNIYPVGMIHSSTTSVSEDFKNCIPDLFTYDSYNEDAINNFIERQKTARQHLSNPWAVLILDDVLKDRKMFNSDLQGELMKMSRHYKMTYIVAAQNPRDVPANIRSNFDWVVILKENIESEREFIYKNYASIIPKQYFDSIMNETTGNHTALVVNNTGDSNEWTNNIFWWKISKPPDSWSLGCKEYRDFHNERYDPESC